MTKNFTSVGQAEKLVAAGLNPRTADMVYIGSDKDSLFPNLRSYKSYSPSVEPLIPCWSCANLLALLPDEIIIHETGKLRRHYRLEISKFEPWRYAVSYVYGFYPEDEVLHETDSIDSLTDALVEMLVWVMQNKYEDKEVHNEIGN